MRRAHSILSAKLVSIATLLVGGYFAGNAGAVPQLARRVAPSAPAPAPAPPPVAPVAAIVARPVAPAPVPAPVPSSGAQTGANKRIATVPISQSHGKAVNRNYVPFPTKLIHTLDSKVCAQHAGLSGGFGCSAGLPKGMLALVWDCVNCKVDGYRLFRVDGGKREPVSIPANGGDFTAALLDAPSGGFGGRCYAAVAYRGATESELSNSYCTDGASVMTTNTLQPDHIRSSSAMDMDNDIHYYSQDGLLVGATHSTMKGNAFLGDSWTNQIARGALHFNLATLSKKQIFSAKLHLTVSRTELGNGKIDHNTSCTSAIALAIDAWWKNADWIQTVEQHDNFDTTARLQPGPASGPDVVYDVTPIVVDWANGNQANFGFVLMTADQGIAAFTESGCATTYESGMTLEVTYSG